jgi:glycogen debranching enzyme
MSDFEPLPFIEMKTSNPAVNRAYRIAMGDLIGNVRLFQDGLLDVPQPVILAGLDYDTPWTRDAAINVWNGLGLVWPETARSTLLAVLERREDRLMIGGQYWDAIIWAVGAWAYYCFSGDRQFLSLAFESVANSLERFEREEFDPRWGLFRGPAVYGDGVAAYPDRYSPGGTSSILDWVQHNPGRKASRGYGIPMLVLSTNCVYAYAYRIVDWMAAELGVQPVAGAAQRAAALAERLETLFWNPETGTFKYLLDSQGECDHQEGLGHAFALLFDLVSPKQAHSILENQHLAPAGIPCVWPSFSRYTALGGYGRHSGTVWPFISGFWGEAALKHGRPDLFEREFLSLTASINDHEQCAEIYHPLTGEMYGGLQEGGSGPDGMLWASCARQSWTASAYLRLLLTGLFGLQFDPQGITFNPYLPAGVDRVEIEGLSYRACRMSIRVEGRGGQVAQFSIDGESAKPFLNAAEQGERKVHIQMAE